MRYTITTRVLEALEDRKGNFISAFKQVFGWSDFQKAKRADKEEFYNRAYKYVIDSVASVIDNEYERVFYDIGNLEDNEKFQVTYYKWVSDLANASPTATHFMLPISDLKIILSGIATAKRNLGK